MQRGWEVGGNLGLTRLAQPDLPVISVQLPTAKHTGAEGTPGLCPLPLVCVDRLGRPTQNRPVEGNDLRVWRFDIEVIQISAYF